MASNSKKILCKMLPWQDSTPQIVTRDWSWKSPSSSSVESLARNSKW